MTMEEKIMTKDALMIYLKESITAFEKYNSEYARGALDALNAILKRAESLEVVPTELIERIESRAKGYRRMQSETQEGQWQYRAYKMVANELLFCLEPFRHTCQLCAHDRRIAEPKILSSCQCTCHKDMIAAIKVNKPDILQGYPCCDRCTHSKPSENIVLRSNREWLCDECYEIRLSTDPESFDEKSKEAGK